MLVASPNLMLMYFVLFFFKDKESCPVCGYYGLFVLSVCSSNIFHLSYVRAYVHSKGICVTLHRSSPWLLVRFLMRCDQKQSTATEQCWLQLLHGMGLTAAGCKTCARPCAPGETLVFVPHDINVLHRFVPSQLLCPALISAILQSSCCTDFTG